jgi:GNAT superfamily N-acetyltransferase
LKTDGFETVSVWIPPSGTELSANGEQRLPGLLRVLVGSRASEVAELLRRFDQAHPRNEPHYYLSLLGTRDEHRGRGLGMALLKQNLARIDAERMPAYLESSNPANNHRYRIAWLHTGRLLSSASRWTRRDGDVSEAPMSSRVAGRRE